MRLSLILRESFLSRYCYLFLGQAGVVGRGQLMVEAAWCFGEGRGRPMTGLRLI